MAAELASVDQNQDLVIDSKLMNEGWTWSGSGANPWHLDTQTESILFLTNMSGQGGATQGLQQGAKRYGAVPRPVKLKCWSITSIRSSSTIHATKPPRDG